MQVITQDPCLTSKVCKNSDEHVSGGSSLRSCSPCRAWSPQAPCPMSPKESGTGDSFQAT
ncbi:hypothetical protein Nmel_017854 [Mimus melanotis]